MKLGARNIGFAHGPTPVLGNISFSAVSGEFIALLGPNGAGKSTLLRCLAGLLSPSEGDVLLDGRSVRELTVRERARRIAYLPQLREAHWGVSVERVAALGRFAYGAPDRLAEADRAAVARALADADIVRLANRSADSLSGGELARMHLARALAAEAPVILLDEPVAALDVRHQLAIMALLRARARQGALVVAALHDLDLAARHATRAIVLGDGRLAADGPPRDVFRGDIVERIFGVCATFGGESLRLDL
jgi:iron complex transport system ATP-binding protein